ncbi:hypothetical protein N656DRAFT_802165 [Canariomyces notabilis]|uniref:Uncharacterized protein n=1 Tax=Canariomyces notabilis TaxID=2074819 RepID=A0AAN6QG02_9PEZI|nr:hypothetical protein N656DRAFT_802165 [Canariomyces arenarius]
MLKSKKGTIRDDDDDGDDHDDFFGTFRLDDNRDDHDHDHCDKVDNGGRLASLRDQA